MRLDHGRKVGRRENDPRARMFENVVQFGAMQLGIDRHTDQSRMPDGIERRHIIRRVAGDDGNAVAVR